MSRTFSVKNKKSLFKKLQVMTVEQLLSIIDGIIIAYPPSDPDEFDRLLVSKLSDIGEVLLALHNKSCRAISIAYDKKDETYNITIFTPSTTMDWEFAICFIEALANKIKSEIIDEEGIKYIDNHITYDYKKDIEAGIISMSHYPDSRFCGVNYDFCFNNEQIEKINSSKDKVKTFDKLCFKHQYTNGSLIKPKFYQTNNGVIGVYTISHSENLILPKEPLIECTMNGNKINYWVIYVVVFDRKGNATPLGELDYKIFINSLPRDKYYYLDRNYILVNAFKKQELIDFFNKEKPQ